MSGTFAVLCITLAIQVMTSLSMLAVPVLASTAAADVGVSATYVGIYVSLVYFGAMIASLFGGSLVLRFGAIRVSQVCLLFCGAGLATAILATPAALVAAALLIGCGYGPVTPASSHVLAKTTPPHLTGLIFSLKQTGVPLGGALAGIVVPPLVLAAGWRMALAVIAVVCLVLAFLAQPTRRRLDDERDPGRRLGLGALFAPLKLVVGKPQLRGLAFASLCYATVQMCLMGFLVNYLVRDLAMSLVEAGATLAVAQTGGVIGRVVWGFIADRWIAPRRMLGLLGLMMAIGASLASAFTTAWPIPLLYAACLLFGAAAIGWNGVHLAQIARLAPGGKVGLATGGTLFFSYFGVFAGPPLFGALVGAGLSYGGAYLLLVVPALTIGLRFSLSQPHAAPSPSRAATG